MDNTPLKQFPQIYPFYLNILIRLLQDTNKYFQHFYYFVLNYLHQ